jgi:hypothetical protein
VGRFSFIETGSNNQLFFNAVQESRQVAGYTTEEGWSCVILYDFAGSIEMRKFMTNLKIATSHVSLYIPTIIYF